MKAKVSAIGIADDLTMVLVGDDLVLRADLGDWMSARVVLLDRAGDIGYVQQALVGVPGLRVELADRLPRGPGVVALLVPPEVAVRAGDVAALPDLRIVAATSTGYDHLEVEALAAAGVWATHSPGYCDEEVAEHAVAFAVNLLRGVTSLDRGVRAGRWDWRLAPPRPVAGAVLAIVGLGRIGREVAWRARGLGMRVTAHDPGVSVAEMDRLGVQHVADLHELLREADVVTLHVPLNASTRGMIDETALAAMAAGAYLVNCARAALVDHEALGAALAAGRLGGCALDVLPDEPPAPDEPALHWPRTIINPHAAWYSPRAAATPYRRAGEAVAAVLRGDVPESRHRAPAYSPTRPGGMAWHVTRHASPIKLRRNTTARLFGGDVLGASSPLSSRRRRCPNSWSFGDRATMSPSPWTPRSRRPYGCPERVPVTAWPGRRCTPDVPLFLAPRSSGSSPRNTAEELDALFLGAA